MAYFGRGLNKAQNPYTLKDMYKQYIKDKKEGTPYHVPYSVFVKLCTEFYKDIMKYILEGGLYILPYRMGTLSVVKKKPKKFDFYSVSLDWKRSVEAGKQVFHFNDHTSYYKFRFLWEKKNAYFANKGTYGLVLSRENKRNLAKYIKSGDYEYFDRP